MGALIGNKNASKYDEKLVVEICNLVADGMNIKQVLSSDKRFPDWTTWRRWKNENDFVYTHYIQAIQDKGESVDNMIDQTMANLHEGKIDYQTANVIIQTLKWKAGKYYPKMFGDNKSIDHTTKGEAITNEDLRLAWLEHLKK